MLPWYTLSMEICKVACWSLDVERGSETLLLWYTQASETSSAFQLCPLSLMPQGCSLSLYRPSNWTLGGLLVWSLPTYCWPAAQPPQAIFFS